MAGTRKLTTRGAGSKAASRLTARTTKAKAKATAAPARKKRPAQAGSRASLEAALATLPAGAAEQPPDLPIAIALQEANDVATAARKQAAKLRKLPFEHALLEQLPVRIRWLRDAESEWRTVRIQRASKATVRARQEAEELKRELMDAGRYLLRNDREAQGTLDLIAEGDGLADLIEDLHALVRFTHAHGPQMAPADIKGGVEKALDRASGLAESLADAASTERNDTSALAALAHRNGCYALVAQAIREVRAAARYALRKDPVALRPFRSSYHNQQARRSRARKASSATEASGAPPAAAAGGGG